MGFASMSLGSLGLVRGLIGQVLGMALGVGLVVFLRVLAGQTLVWSEEHVWIIASITGVIGFLIGVGAMFDWFKWMRGIETPMHHGPPAGILPGHAILV